MFIDIFTSNSKIMFIVLVVSYYISKYLLESLPFERLLDFLFFLFFVLFLVGVLDVVVLVEALPVVVLVEVGSVAVLAEVGSPTVRITAGLTFVGAVEEVVVRKVA